MTKPASAKPDPATAPDPATRGNLLSRLWIYQAERFPIAKTAPLLAVFSAASISFSAVLADRPLPEWGAYLGGFVVAFLLFFQLRACDEVKDLEDDTRYRPERAIPRGLVSLRLIVGLGWLSVPLAGFAAWAWHPPLLYLLALVWIWLAAMTFEFGVPSWLRKRPTIYLISHMAIMPLIDLLLTGFEWLPHGQAPAGIWFFLALSLSNGCVLELGRKIWAPENEREGVDSYSALWGPNRAVFTWIGFVSLAFVLLLGLGWTTGYFLPIAVIGVAAFAYCLWTARNFIQAPSPQNEKRLDTIAGLWVFICYGTAGFVPAILRAL